VRYRTNGNNLRAGKCGYRINHRILVGRILVNHGDVALAPIWDENQFLGRIRSQGVRASPFFMVAPTLPVLGLTTTDVLLQPETIRSDALSYAMPVGPFTRGVRPRGGGFPGLDVYHLNCVLTLMENTYGNALYVQRPVPYTMRTDRARNSKFPR